MKVFRYSFSEAIPIFFNRLKSVFSQYDRYKIFTSNWRWIEICENVVLSKIDITVTTIQLFEKTLSKEKQKAHKPRLQGNMEIFETSLQCRHHIAKIFPVARDMDERSVIRV